MAVLASASLLVALAACNDAPTPDDRGYSKAPLEKPGWIVRPEHATAMAKLGEPITVPSLDTDTAMDAPAAAAPAQDGGGSDTAS